MNRSLHIEQRLTESLKPYCRNARTHSKKQVRQIARSIEEFGFTNPILIDEVDEIIAGHGRLEAARLLRLKTIPVIVLTGLNDAQKRALRLTDNKLAANAGWDPKILAIEFESFLEIDAEFDLSITGFEVPEIDLALQYLHDDDEENESDYMANLDNTTPVVSRPGDLWRLGGHRLLCADARDPASFDKLMSDEKAQMVFADPPYNVAIDGNVSGRGQTKHGNFLMAAGEMSGDEFQDFLTTVLSNLAQHSLEGSLHYICMDWRHLFELLSVGRKIYSELKNVCVWNKTNGGLGSFYRSKHELICVFKRGTKPHINNVQLGRYGRNRSIVWDYAGANAFHDRRLDELQNHPTTKPVGLVADAILDASHRNGIVVDGFSGSGTIIIAAQKTERRAYAIEIDPRFVDITIRRFEAYSGEIVIHAESGKSFDEIVNLRSQIKTSQKEEQKDESINVRGTHVR